MSLFQKTIFCVAVFCGVAILLSLGTWQVFRLEEKQKLLAQIEEGFSQAPETLLKRQINNDFLYKKTLLSGTVLDKNFYLLQQKRKGESGYEILTPLQEGDITVLVNFGWTKHNTASTNSQRITPKAGKHYLLMGYFIPFSKDTVFRPQHQSGNTDILWLEKDFIEQETGYPVFDYVFKVIDTIQGLPNVAPHEVHIDVPNNHFQYAVFWYVMALILIIMAILVWRKKQ